MANLKFELKSMFELMDIGESSKIVGIEITQDENSITIKQSAYITEILRNYGMEDAHAVKTPLDLNIKLEKNPEGMNGDQSNYLHH